MTVRYHDHPAAPGGVSAEDLDLYAVHALPEAEADAIETALISASPEDTASMLAHIASTREVMADMVAGAGLDTAPPAALRGRILELAASIPTGPTPPTTGRSVAPTDVTTPGGADLVDLSRERQRRRPGPLTFVGVAAAAVALVAAGVTIGRLTDGLGGDALPVASPPATSMPGQVTSLLAASDLEVARGPVAGSGVATVLASRAEDMAVISMTGLPEPPTGSAYQLWLMGDHEPISAGTMEAGQVGPAPSAQINGIRGSAQIGITVEPAGGSPAPTGDVILALDI